MRLAKLGSIAALCLVAGCTTARIKPPAAGAKYVLDEARMAAISHGSLQRGVRVIWVNPPMRSAR